MRLLVREHRDELAGWDHEKDEWSLEVAKNSNYMHPRQVLRELEKAMPADAMVSTDIGNICQVANCYLQFEQPRSMFGAMMFGRICTRRMRNSPLPDSRAACTKPMSRRTLASARATRA